MKKLILAAIIALLGMTVTGCQWQRDSEVASHNLSYKADAFEINRRVVFYNGITNQYMFVITGFCSIKKDNKDKQLEVTCKVGPGQFKKHYLGLSDNVTYFVEQISSKNVSTYHYSVIFKPAAIIPDINIK